MASRTGKMSEIMKEMAERLLRDPGRIPSAEAMHVALFFATAAWNESVGLIHPRERYRNVWETIEAGHPALWNELKSATIDELLDELVRYKQAHFAEDRRRILLCGTLNGRIRVEWLPPAAPGVDPQWETNFYGLVRTGDRSGAIRFLQKTRRLSRAAAQQRVDRAVAELGMF